MNGETVVLCAFGPKKVRTTALRRARALVGPRGSVIVVPANRLALPAVAGEAPADNGIANGGAANGVVATESVAADTAPADTAATGTTALREALTACPPGPVLLVHDDVLVTRPVLDRLVAAHHRTGGFPVPHSNDEGVDHFAGPLPPSTRAAEAVRGASRLFAGVERSAHRVRPSCLVGDRDALRDLLPLHLPVARTVIDNPGRDFTVVAGTDGHPASGHDRRLRTRPSPLRRGSSVPQCSVLSLRCNSGMCFEQWM